MYYIFTINGQDIIFYYLNIQIVYSISMRLLIQKK